MTPAGLMWFIVKAVPYMTPPGPLRLAKSSSGYSATTTNRDSFHDCE